MEFKVGQKVKLIDDDGGWLQKEALGTIGKVTDIDGDYYIVKFDCHKKSISVYKDRLELVSENSELQELVDQANTGIAAIYEIIKSNLVETYDVHTNNSVYCPSEILTVCRDHVATGYRSGSFKLRVKQKFTHFRLRDWDVTLTGDELKIGCKTYPASILKKELFHLTKNNNSCSSSSSGYSRISLAATRDGLKDLDGNFITWEEADELLKKLEDSGV